MAYAVITGNLGKDPELRTSKDGRTTYATTSIAWTEQTRDATGQWHDGPTIWVQTTIYGRQAHNAVASLQKGARVIAIGTLRPETWPSQNGPETMFTLIADTIAPDLTFATASISRNPRETDTPLTPASQAWHA